MIERLIIHNFKGIKSADIEFNAFKNILVGNNGVRKGAYAPYFFRLKTPRFPGIFFVGMQCVIEKDNIDFE